MGKMKLLLAFLFLILADSINCSLYTNTTIENVPFAYETPLWQEIFKIIEEKKNLLPFSFSSNLPKLKAELSECVVCNIVVGALLMERAFDMTNIQEAAEVAYFCTLLKIEHESICDGVVNLNVDSLGYIVDHQDSVNSEKICSLLMGCTAGADTSDWTIDIPDGDTTDKVNSTGDKTFKIAHITDIHYDPNYEEDKVLDCGEPSCCQKDQPAATGNETKCGYWSSVKSADSPLRLVEAALDQMVKQGGFDYVYFTGDLVSHRVWGTSQEFNSKSISDIMDLFAKKFDKTPVYPILGNHETHPVNVYAPLNITDNVITNQWLFDTVSEKWSKWLGTDVVETVKKGGYYTVSPQKGFRIIVLNNNVCQTQNWWNLYDDYDPYGQLTWLVKTLKQAEDDKEIVHILSHIPNASCLKVWGREFNKIIQRFSNTIAALFNGHTHRDQFQIYYDKENHPINVVINGASLMPDKANPNYKIYTVDSKGYDVMDAELYTFDLEKANADPNHHIDWYKLYSYKEDFGVEKLIASELDKLIKKMENDTTLVNKYHNFYWRNSAAGQADCDKACQKRYLCEIVTTVRGENSLCVA